MADTNNIKLVESGKRKVSCFVHDVLKRKTCETLQGYYKLRATGVNTRNNESMLVIPTVKLDYARKSIKFMGAKIFNELPLHVRKKCLDDNFKNIIRTFSF